MDGTKQDLKGNQAVPALNAGQTFSLQVSLEVRTETLPGQYKVQACADGGKDVAESNEDDNCLTSSGIVKVVGPPDLIVTQVTVRNAPLTVARGGDPHDHGGAEEHSARVRPRRRRRSTSSSTR